MIFKPFFNKFRTVRVTDEHHYVSEDLLNHKLASPGRRGLAMFADFFVCILITIPWLLMVLLISISLQSPKTLPAIWEYRNLVNAEKEGLKTVSKEKKDKMFYEISMDIARIVARWQPRVLPRDLRKAIEEKNMPEFVKCMKKYETDIALGSGIGSDDASYFDFETNTIHLRLDAFLGSATFFLSSLSLLLFYFTLTLWKFKGHTVGKMLARIRVVRIDGKRLTLWDCFGRAGGYSASLSTLGLGFLEAIWHPNRQTVHDRIAGTVVIEKIKTIKKTKK